MTEEPKRKNGIETLRLMAALAMVGTLPQGAYEIEHLSPTKRIQARKYREKKSEAVRWVNGRMVRKDGAE